MIFVFHNLHFSLSSFFLVASLTTKFTYLCFCRPVSALACQRLISALSFVSLSSSFELNKKNENVKLKGRLARPPLILNYKDNINRILSK